jgi:GH43 family beta-xylosidase
MTENELKINWRGNEVGKLVEWMPDMWYVEGKWIGNGSVEAAAFESLIKTFEAKQIMADPTKGTRVTLVENEVITQGYIIAMTDDSLCVRRVFEKEAVEWLLKNVK